MPTKAYRIYSPNGDRSDDIIVYVTDEGPGFFTRASENNMVPHPFGKTPEDPSRWNTAHECVQGNRNRGRRMEEITDGD